MESTKLETTYCKDVKDNEKILKIRKAVLCFLKQCTNDIRDSLIALTRITDRNVAKCIENKLSCVEINIFNEFCVNNTITIDNTNAGRFVDFVLQSRTLLLGNSQLISDDGKQFLDSFEKIAKIYGSKFDFEKPIEIAPKVKVSTVEIEEGEVKEPLKWGRVNAKTYNRIYNQKKLEVLLEKKEIQFAAYNRLDWLYKQCYQMTRREEESKPAIIEKDKEDFILLKEHLVQELEKEIERYESTVTAVLKEEEELIKHREKEENALFIIIDRYDAEIGGKQSILEDLQAKRNYQSKRLDKLKKKARMQDLEYERALDAEVQWEIEDIEKQLSKLKLMKAHRFLQIYLTAYVHSWKQGRLNTPPKK